MEVHFIEHGSEAYLGAANLRYRVFYQPHGLNEDITTTQDDAQDCHVAILQEGSKQVLAYGRLAHTAEQCSVHQMVVEPDWQGQGLGTLVLQILLERARQLGCKSASLSARVPQVGFYERHGFQLVGDAFPSATTGVIHVKMEAELHHES